jgi:hypothetical protein
MLTWFHFYTVRCRQYMAEAILFLQVGLFHVLNYHRPKHFENFCDKVTHCILWYTLYQYNC